MARGSLNLRDLVARIFVKADKRSADQADAEIKGTFSKWSGYAKTLAASFAAAFSVGVITQFAKVSIQAAIDAERVWSRLSGTLASAGVEFAKVEQRVRAGARAMRDAAGIGDDEYAATLGRLVSLTGDFNLSLSQMGLVADVAARFFGGDLAPAVDLVARALNGQTRSLREVGIVTTDVNEGLRILRERSAGAAENELESLAGRMGNLRRAMGEVREELGAFIIRLGGGDTETATTRFAGWLDKIADKLSRLEVVRWNTSGPIPFPVFRRNAGEAPPATDPTASIAQLDPIIGVFDRGAATRQDTEVRLRAQQESERRALAERQRMARNAAGTNRMNAIANASGISGRLQGGLTSIGGLGEQMTIPDSEALAEFEQQWTSMWGNITSVTQNAAMGIAGAFQDTFSLIIEGGANARDVMVEIGRGIAGALVGGIAEYASVKAGEQVAEGVADLAAGTWPPNPAAWAAAAQHFKSAGLFGIIAGASGAVQGALGGGGRGGMSGGIPSGASDIGGRLAQQTVPKNQIIIYVDGIDPRNGNHVRLIGQTIKEAARTDSTIDIRPRNGR